MRRMLEEFYYGNLNPNERSFIRDSTYSQAIRTISETRRATNCAIPRYSVLRLFRASIPKYSHVF